MRHTRPPQSASQPHAVQRRRRVFDHLSPAVFTAAFVGLVLAAAPPCRAQFYDVLPYEQAPISYADTPTTDPVARLQQRLAKGEATIEADDAHGYLKAVLRELKVDESSQLLVFSKTSFQFRRITPQRPRAVYFNDDVYVGWVQGSDIVELSAVDPKQGAIFYTLEPNEQGRPVLKREGQCLTCHASSRSQGVPGHLMRSIYPDAEGRPTSGSATYNTDHRSPLSQRWGGWYVTGTHGQARHMGNELVRHAAFAEDLDTDAGANITDLSKLFDTKPYLTPDSDIVAHLVLDHQVHLHNLFARANYETRLALYRQAVMDDALAKAGNASDPGHAPGKLSDSAQERLQRVADEVVRYMLFVDETDLRDPIQGTSPFAERFQKLGPFDRHGRSLRQFDLHRWLFKYPCSFLIYSEAFDSLPRPMLDLVYRRLWDILSGRDRQPPFNLLSTADCRAILEILRDTKPTLPDYWRNDAETASK
jgi:hypothetical protein